MPALRELGRGGRLGALTLFHLRVGRACGNLELELDEELHQATFSRWLRPRASTTLACTGATSSLALSEPNGAPTTVRTGRLPFALPTRSAIGSATTCRVWAA